jgi:hypothetical protein
MFDIIPFMHEHLGIAVLKAEKNHRNGQDPEIYYRGSVFSKKHAEAHIQATILFNIRQLEILDGVPRDMSEITNIPIDKLIRIYTSQVRSVLSEYK